MKHGWLTLLAEESAPPAGGGTPTTGAPAPGGGGAEAAPAGGSPGMTMFLFFGLTLAVMYFLMIRPQSRKEKELRAMVERLKKNDKVVLQSGIFGVVMNVRPKDVIVKIDEKQDVRIRVLKSAIIGIEGASPDEAVEDKKDEKKLEEKSEAEA